MAGQPKKRAMIAELERRTREEFGSVSTETHADYAAHWIENGGTILGLAESISGACSIHVMRATLSKYLNEIDADWEERGQRARARGSIAMVDQAAELAELEHDKDSVPGVKLRIDTKLKVAQMFNTALRDQKTTNVAISFGGMHLDAMRRRALPRATVALSPSIEENTVDFTVESASQVQD